MDADAIVVGAGTAGLAAALELQGRGVDVRVLEAEARPGGHARHEAEGGYLFARGPQAFLARSPHLLRLAARLGLATRLVSATSPARRFLFLDGRLVELPAGPGGLASSPFLSWRGKLRLLAEPFVSTRASSSESVHDFVARRLGAEAARNLAGPFVSGVYAGDARQLELRSAFPTLHAWDAEVGSLLRGALRHRRSASPPPPGVPRRGLLSFARGLVELTDAAAAQLGPRLELGTDVERVERAPEGFRVATASGALSCRRLVLAVPPPAAARLLEPLDAEASRLALSVPMAPVAVVHLGGPLGPAERAPRGFGVLVQRESGLDTLGIIFTSSLLPGRAPEGAWLQAAYVGGVTNPDAIERDDADLRATVAADTRRALGFDPDRGVARVIRHRAAIPQFVSGHRDRIEALRARARAAGLVLAGNWLDGVGLEQAAASGHRAAEELAA